MFGWFLLIVMTFTGVALINACALAQSESRRKLYTPDRIIALHRFVKSLDANNDIQLQVDLMNYMRIVDPTVAMQEIDATTKLLICILRHNGLCPIWTFGDGPNVVHNRQRFIDEFGDFYKKAAYFDCTSRQLIQYKLKQSTVRF